LLLSSEQGNSSIVLLNDSKESTIILEAVFILESIAPKELHIERFLSPTPIRVLLNHELKEEELTIEEINLTALKINPEKVFSKPEISKLVKLMLDKTEDIAEERANEITTQSLEKMNNILAYEAKRLIELKRVNPNVTEMEIEFARERILALNENIAAARLRLDSLRLICSDPDEW
jgi:ATP-dependent helicase HepA